MSGQRFKRSYSAARPTVFHRFPALPPEEVEPLGEDWEQVDLTPALRGDIEAAAPTVLVREDGAALFYAGQFNSIHGDSGTGKSWVLAVAAWQQMADGQHVCWVDFEEPNAATIVERLRSLGVSDHAIRTQLHYFGPKSPTTDEAVDRLCQVVEQAGATLVVLDSLGEAFGVEGINEDRDNEVAPWLRRVLRRLADTGACVVAIDHSTKAAENPLFPSGSKRKRAAVTGASYLVKAPKPLTREHGGRLTLTVAKDRHGHYARGSIAAQIEVTVYPDGGATWHVTAPSGAGEVPKVEWKARDATEAVKRYTDREGSAPTQHVVLADEEFTGRNELRRAALDLACARGALRPFKGERNATYYEWVRPFEVRPATPSEAADE